MTDDTRETARHYIVYSREHNLWWRKNRSGYTYHMPEAGRYTHDEAAEICMTRSPTDDGPPEFMVLAPETADHMEQLQRALDKAERERDEYKRQADGYYGEAAKALDERDATLAEVERLKKMLNDRHDCPYPDGYQRLRIAIEAALSRTDYDESGQAVADAARILRTALGGEG